MFYKQLVTKKLSSLIEQFGSIQTKGAPLLKAGTN